MWGLGVGIRVRPKQANVCTPTSSCVDVDDVGDDDKRAWQEHPRNLRLGVCTPSLTPRQKSLGQELVHGSGSESSAGSLNSSASMRVLQATHCTVDPLLQL